MNLAKASYLLERFMHAGLTPHLDMPPHLRQEWVAWGERLDAHPDYGVNVSQAVWDAMSKKEQLKFYKARGGKMKIMPTPHKRMELK